MSFLDHFVKHELGIKYYGRYVDDFFLIHSSREYLSECKSQIIDFLRKELLLEINPSKIYLQTLSYGVKFLGVCIRPGRVEISRRTARNFISKVNEINMIAEDHKPNSDELKSFVSSLNSYLGLCVHFDTFRFRYDTLMKQDLRVRDDVCKCINNKGCDCSP